MKTQGFFEFLVDAGLNTIDEENDNLKVSIFRVTILFFCRGLDIYPR